MYRPCRQYMIIKVCQVSGVPLFCYLLKIKMFASTICTVMDSPELKKKIRMTEY